MNVLNDNPHSAHCRLCKQRVAEMLGAIYGGCEQNYSFGWLASPRDYAKTPIGATLERIQSSLENFRANRDFIKSPLVPPAAAAENTSSWMSIFQPPLPTGTPERVAS